MQERRFNDFEIGPSGRMRRVRGLLGYVLLFGLFGAVFAYLFFMLTLSWKVALGSVTILIGYMVLMGWWAERSSVDSR